MLSLNQTVIPLGANKCEN